MFELGDHVGYGDVDDVGSVVYEREEEEEEDEDVMSRSKGGMDIRE